MHATIKQASDQRAQTYAIQSMHAIMIQTIDHGALHKHMQFQEYMLQSITELIITVKNE